MYCPSCGKQNPDNISTCQYCGSAIYQSKKRLESYINHNDPLLDFLKRANNLEKARYTLSEIYSRIQNQISFLGIPKSITSPEKEEHTLASAGVSFFLLLIIAMGFALSRASSDMNIAFLAEIVVIAVFIIPIILCCRSIAKVRKRNRKKEEKYLQQVASDKERVTIEEKQIQELKEQQNSISAKINEVSEQLNRLYGLGMVYKKYCNFVAVATMIEYFESGRCTQLTGPDGAYNLYEKELFDRIIIGKLDQILDNLEIIRDSQYTLYEAITEATETCKSIEGQNRELIKANHNLTSNTNFSAFIGQVSTLDNETALYVGQHINL